MPLSRRSGTNLTHSILKRIRPAPVAVILKRILKVRRFNLGTEHGPFFIDPVSVLGYALLKNRVYEREMVEVLERYLEPGCFFVELGANEGYFSILAAGLVEESGSVLAVEPQERLRDILSANIRSNGFNTISISDRAISDRNGSAQLFLSPDTNSGSSSFTRATRYAVLTSTIRTVTLSALLNENDIETVDLMKIDIEGLEYEAILGSREVFESLRIRTIALEMHPKPIRERGLNSGEITEFLDRCGYQVDRALKNLVLRPPGEG